MKDSRTNRHSCDTADYDYCREAAFCLRNQTKEHDCSCCRTDFTRSLGKLYYIPKHNQKKKKVHRCWITIPRVLHIILVYLYIQNMRFEASPALFTTFGRF